VQVRELPSGTVTLLFTDIEGSTRLLHELGEQYAEVLAQHRRAMRDAFSQHGGVEVDTQGDAFEDEDAGAPRGGWRRHREACKARIREATGPEFERGYTVGRDLTLDDAVSVALERDFEGAS
jgi:class 3 adenylate cyclase